MHNRRLIDENVANNAAFSWLSEALGMAAVVEGQIMAICVQSRTRRLGLGPPALRVMRKKRSGGRHDGKDVRLEPKRVVGFVITQAVAERAHVATLENLWPQ